MSENIKEYTVWMHWKQGDEFATHLEAAQGNVSDALNTWGDHFKMLADRCKHMSQMTRGYNLTAYGDVNHIALTPHNPEAARLLDSMVQEKMIAVESFDDDEPYVPYDGSMADPGDEHY